jgi:hypothetical protein
MKFSSFGFIGSEGLDVDYLIVAGGQAGENSNQTDYAGFGGAGGGYTANQTSIALGVSYPIVVGLGGVAGGVLGGTSSFNNIVSVNPNPTSPATITCGTGSTVTYKQGGSGAASTGSLPFCLGTGPDNSGKGGDGGSGSIWYDGNYYAGGGGSATFTSVAFAGVGGIGGGGLGGYNNALAVTGSKNTGGGGGGGSQFGTGAGADGGSGIVKIRYYGTGSKAIGGTITYSGEYTYHSFTASGTFTTL